MRTTLSVVSLLVVLVLPCALLSAATNPKAVIETNRGNITVELWPTVAPKTVENFIALASGTKGFTDPATQQEVKRPFYDGLTFHRVIDNFMIQGGCPKGNGSGGPGYKFADEISAKALGLDKDMLIVGEQLNPKCAYMMGQLRAKVIMPRMQTLGVTQTSSKEDQQAAFAKVKKEMEAMTLADFYEALGYVYQANLPSKQPVKGALCMANAGPNTNGSQFFINLVDTPHLAGKHTVFGAVVEGMDVVQAIGKTPVNGQTPQEAVVIKKVVILPGA